MSEDSVKLKSHQLQIIANRLDLSRPFAKNAIHVKLRRNALTDSQLKRKQFE